MTTSPTIDMVYISSRIKQNKWWLAASMVIAIILGLIVIQLLPVKYKILASLQVDNHQHQAVAQELFDGIALPTLSNNNANEIAILKSFALIKETLSAPTYQVSYYKRSGLRYQAVDLPTPFTIQIDTTVAQLVEVPVSITFTDATHYRVQIDATEGARFSYTNGGYLLPTLEHNISVDTTQPIDQFFETDFIRFKLTLHSNTPPAETYRFIIHDLNALAASYREQLDVAPISKDATILTVSLASPTPLKDQQFIDALMNHYVARQYRQQNQQTQHILDFIDHQLGHIADSLHHAELTLQQFRANHNLLDADYEAKNLYDDLTQLEKEKSEVQIQYRYYQHLNQSVKQNDSLQHMVAPSVIGLDDPSLSHLINQLSSYLADQTAMQYSTNAEHPKYHILQENIEHTRKALLENIANIILATEIKLHDIDDRLTGVRKKFNQLPENERMLLNAQRQFEFNDHIYRYFLQKKGEVGILKESNAPSLVVIDHARLADDEPVSPNKKLILLALATAGLMLPMGLLFTQDLLSTRIRQKQDLPACLPSGFQLLQNIPAARTRRPFQTIPPACHEAFRSLALKIMRIQNVKVMAITSPIPKDGKSFCALHLSQALAQTNKRVTLVDLHPTHPTLTQTLLPAHETSVEPATTIPNIQLLTLTSPNDLHQIIQDHLTTSADYIIIDCPPLITSANFLAIHPLAHLSLFIIRRNHTPASLPGLTELETLPPQAVPYHVVFNGH